MGEPKRTPGQAEGTEEDVQSALGEKPKGKQRTGGSKDEQMDREPGRTPGQAEGTEEQAEGSLRNQK